jgi:hypothetical protein
MVGLPRRSLITGAVAAVGLLSGGCSGDGGPRVENTRDQVLKEYMSAVQAGDVERLRKLSNPESQPTEIDAAISRRIAAVGARPWADPTVQWTELVTPEMAKATITASDDMGHRLVDVVYMAVINKRWCVSFGPGTDEATAGLPRPS